MGGNTCGPRVTYEPERTDDRWESVWGPGPADLGKTPHVEPKRVRTLRGLIKAYPMRAATWLIVPIFVAWGALSERFSGIDALLLGILIGTAIGLAVLFATARGWIDADASRV